MESFQTTANSLIQRPAAADARSQQFWNKAFLAVVVVFFVVGVLSIDQFGATWDEFQSFEAGLTNLRFDSIPGTETPQNHFPPGYYFVLDTVRAAFAEAVAYFFFWVDKVNLFHFFHLTISTSCLALLYLIVRAVSGQSRLALFSVCSLALLPQFVGHSQNNPKDVPALFTFLLITYSLIRYVTGTRSRWAWLSAASIGLALTTRLLAVFLFPILLVFFLTRWRQPFLRRWRGLVLICLGGLAAAFLCWPWLWLSPLQNVSFVAKSLGDLFPELNTLYLGKVYRWADVPWHYLIVELLVSLPICVVLCLGLSVPALFYWRADDVPKADVIYLGAVWTIGLLIAEQLSPYRYDGIRHFFPILAGMAMLIGSGADFCVDVLIRAAGRTGRPRVRTLAAGLLPAVFAVVTLVELAFQHPYETAYVNPIVGRLIDGPTERFFEVEYWGNAYKEGGAWINQHTAPDTVVYHVPSGGELVKYYVDRPVLPSDEFGTFEDSKVPKCVMFITRIAWYDDLMRRLDRDDEPVFTIKRQRATLLKIYYNRPIAN